MDEGKIAFIGGGNMARAIAGGLIEGNIQPRDILVAEPQQEARERLVHGFPGITVSDDNNAITAAAGCVVLAVKPQILPAVCRSLETTVQARRPLVISIAAGVMAADIDDWLGGGLAIVRVMPNQPSLIGLGVSGLYANDRTTSRERERAVEIMAAVGRVVTVNSEADIDAVTAVSGSGPAYFFLLIDMLTKASIDLGLEADAAILLAVETARGAAELAAREDEPMESLIARVRSPGGTTAAALDSLESSGVRAIFSAAITAARDRATELAEIAHSSKS